MLAGGVSALLAACSSLHGAQPPGAAAPQAVVQPASPASPAGSLTATQAAIAAAGAQGAQSQPAAAPASAPVIRSTAPMTYTVKRGDTLWGIASTFLRNPWDWPEVWYLNPNIHNPHLIYPGDVLQLAYGHDGRPQVRLLRGSPLRGSTLRLEPRLRSTPLSGAIPLIRSSAIANFLTRPTVLTAAQIRHAPHVIAFRSEHQAGGDGSVAYVSDLGADPRSRYSVIHVAHKLRDAGMFGSTLGYLGIYTATALIRAPGDPATAVLTDAARETFAGDRLIAGDAATSLTMEPSAPSQPVHGKIIWIVGGSGQMDLAGQFDIVVLNRGTDAGVVPGNVLAANHAEGTVRDTHGGMGQVDPDFAPRVKLPDERAATLLVFKSYPRLSFALVVTATNTLGIGDTFENP